MRGELPEQLKSLQNLKGALFSKIVIDDFIEDEARHDRNLLAPQSAQSLQSMSSGERKKALLKFLLKDKADFLLLDNPFDNLDRASQKDLKDELTRLSKDICFVQFISRKEDLLPFVGAFARLNGRHLSFYDHLMEAEQSVSAFSFKRPIPKAPEIETYSEDFLIQLRKVSVSYGEKPVLKEIFWNVRPGEYWELAGPNGSGKTTILSMITGDNPKAYGQEIYLFGNKKGSGESVWDIKRHIGYFTPAMVDRFRGYHSLENMLISGIHDSIGLYVKPSEAQKKLANEWLALLGMESERKRYFHDLSHGQQRLIMCARAMIKHPLLLILDEPTAGLDDESAALVVSLVNKMAGESNTAVIFVSHRKEPHLRPNFVFVLEPAANGSRGTVLSA